MTCWPLTYSEAEPKCVSESVYGPETTGCSDPVQRTEPGATSSGNGAWPGSGRVCTSKVSISAARPVRRLTWSSTRVATGSPENVGFAKYCAVSPAPVPVAGASTDDGTG